MMRTLAGGNRLLFVLLMIAPVLMLYAIVNKDHSTTTNNILGAVSGVLLGLAILQLIQRPRLQ